MAYIGLFVTLIIGCWSSVAAITVTYMCLGFSGKIGRDDGVYIALLGAVAIFCFYVLYNNVNISIGIS